MQGEGNATGGRSPWALRLVLLAALVHGLLYVFLIPPWQHYDEPTQFEYAWLIASRGRFPEIGEYDQGLRQELAASMVEHDFFVELPGGPNLLSRNRPVWVGISQLQDPPLYYLILAIPLRFVRYLDVTTQLYLVRLISLLFFLLTLIVIHRITRELFPEAAYLHWILPLSIALLPAFVDLMSAANNDVGATFFFSLFLWAGVRLLRRGLSPARAGAALGAALLCLEVKNTVWVALPLVLLLLFFALTLRARPAWRLRTWLVLLAGAVLAGALAFPTVPAALWYRDTQALEQPRPSGPEERSPLGDEHLRVPLSPAVSPGPVLYQPLPPDAGRELQGGWVTLGAWLWASRAAEVRTPGLWVDGEMLSSQVRLGQEPVFWARSYQIPAGAEQIQLVITPGTPDQGKDLVVNYDGLVLAAGRYSLEVTPQFESGDALSGIWGGQPFENLARGPSFEDRWIGVAPGIDRWLSAHTPVNLARTLFALQDRAAFGNVFRATLVNLFQSFFARFGWNHIRLPSPWYWAIAALTAPGLILTLIVAAREAREKPARWRVTLAWLLLALLGVWGGAFFRVRIPVWGQTLFLPGARYAYPAIFPTMLWLVWGGVHTSSRRLPVWGWLALLCVPLLILDIYSLITIMGYYHGV